MKVNYKKAVLCGLLAIIINMVVGNLLYMNPIVAGIFKAYEGHPTMKPIEEFGGQGNWVLLNLLFGLALMIFFIILYFLLYKGLPGNDWKKGVFYGIMIAAIKAVPEAFNQWMLFVYPNKLILIQLANTLVSLILFGTYMGIIFEKFHVIEEKRITSQSLEISNRLRSAEA